ncbi:MAG: molybdopterin-dependent oxidoreductase [Clostridiales bacterium]|jgi:hypothetical protein|nr:molybdopterin-dependent oxidoreductase [Clostridiales bacterium]MDR2713431.1 molybdopterin-dependent oxidoreductase [Clostridiales bacterium]
MTKQAKNVSIILLALALLLAVLAWANSRSLSDTAPAQIGLKLDGDVLALLDKEDLLAFPGHTFTITQRSAGQGIRDYIYTGVELKLIIESQGIDISRLKQVTVRGGDGYISLVSARELQEEDNIYLVYAANGQDLSGKHPYQLVICSDYFALRWCRLVREIEAESL